MFTVSQITLANMTTSCSSFNFTNIRKPKWSDYANCYRLDTLLKPQILYRKNCMQSTQWLYKPIFTLKQQKLNVINYKHETNALAYTFKAGSWQI